MDLVEWTKLVQKPILPGISASWLHSGPAVRKPRGSAEGERQHLVSEAYREYFMRTPRALPFPTVDELERWLAAAVTGRSEPHHPMGSRVGQDAHRATLGFCSLVPGLLADSPHMQPQPQPKQPKQNQQQSATAENGRSGPPTGQGSSNGDYTSNGANNNNTTVTSSTTATTNNAALNNGSSNSGRYSAAARAGRSYLAPMSRAPLAPPSSRSEADHGGTRNVRLNTSLNSLLYGSNSSLRGGQSLNPSTTMTSVAGPGRSMLGSKRKRRGAVQSDDDDGEEDGDEEDDADHGGDSSGLAPPAAKRSLSGSAFSDRARELGDSLERARRQLQEAEHDNLPSSRAAASSSPRALAESVRRAERRRRNEMRRVLEEEQRDFLSHELPRMQAYEELKAKLADEVRQALEKELREPVRRGLQHELREEAQALRESLRAEIREQLLEEMRHEVTYLVRQESQEMARLSSSSMSPSLSSASAATKADSAAAAATAADDVPQKNVPVSSRVSAAAEETTVPASRSLKRRWGSPGAATDGGIHQAAEAGPLHGHAADANQHQRRRIASPRRTPDENLASRHPEYDAPVAGVQPNEMAAGERNAKEEGVMREDEHGNGADANTEDSNAARSNRAAEPDTRPVAPTAEEEGQELQNGDYEEEEADYEEGDNGYGSEPADNAIEYADEGEDGENAYVDLENGQQAGFDYRDYAESAEEGDVDVDDELVGPDAEEGREEPAIPAKTVVPDVIDLCDSDDDDDDAQGQAAGDNHAPAAEDAADGAAVGAAPYAASANQHMPMADLLFGPKPPASQQYNGHGCLNYWVPVAAEGGTAASSSYTGHLDQEAPAPASSSLSSSPLPPHLNEANGPGDANSGYGGDGGSNRLLPLIHSDVSLDTDLAEPAATSVAAQITESEYSESDEEEGEDDEEEDEEGGEDHASDAADTMAGQLAPTASGALPASEEHAEGGNETHQFNENARHYMERVPDIEYQQPAEPGERHEYEHEVAQAMEYVEQSRAGSVRSSGNEQPAAEDAPSYPELPKPAEVDLGVADTPGQQVRGGSPVAAGDEAEGLVAEGQASVSPKDARIVEDAPGGENDLQQHSELSTGPARDERQSEDEQRLEADAAAAGEDNGPVAEEVSDASEPQHVPSQFDVPQPEEAQNEEGKLDRELAAAVLPEDGSAVVEEAEMSIDQQAQETTVEVSYPAILELEEDAQSNEHHEGEYFQERIKESVEVSGLEGGEEEEEEAQGSIEGVEATVEETIILEATATVEVVAQHSGSAGEDDDTVGPASVYPVLSSHQEEPIDEHSPGRQNADAVNDDDAENAKLFGLVQGDVAANAADSPVMDVELAKPAEEAFMEEEEKDETSGQIIQASLEDVNDDGVAAIDDPDLAPEDGLGEPTSPATSPASAVHVVAEDVAVEVDGEGDEQRPMEDDDKVVPPVSEEEKEGGSDIVRSRVVEAEEEEDEDKHDDLGVLPTAEEAEEEEEESSGGGGDEEEPAESAQLSVSQASSVFARPPGGPSNKDIAKQLGSALKPAFAITNTANTENSAADEGAHPPPYSPPSHLSASTSASPPPAPPTSSTSRRGSRVAAAAAATARTGEGKDFPPSGLQNFLYGATDDEGIVGGGRNGTADDAHSSAVSSSGSIP